MVYHDTLSTFADHDVITNIVLLLTGMSISGIVLLAVNGGIVGLILWRYRYGKQQDWRDSTARAAQQLSQQPRYDQLTGLLDRRALMVQMDQLVETCLRDQSCRFALLFLDLDRFSTINDTLGHLAGDQILIEIGARLQTCTPQSASVARMGGDTFIVLVREVGHAAALAATAQQIQSIFSRPFCLAGQEIFMSASIGAVLADNPLQTADSLLREADTAMYQAKGRGGAQITIFDRSTHADIRARLQLEIDLRGALERSELALVYQPIMDLPTGEIRGMEALLRWEHPQRGIIYPNDFIGLAEESGLIVPIGLWTLEMACRQFQSWHSTNALPSLGSISVNLSGKQLANPDLVFNVQQIIERTGIDAHHLELELTESVVMGQAEHAIITLRQLKTLGVQLAIDDFGTGYSSLSYLHQFPMDTLKVDRSFVSSMHANSKHVEIVRTIIALSQNLAMSVIAEGIETIEQAAALRDMGCAYGQGYHFARPLDASKMLVWMQERGDSLLNYHRVAHVN
jgi:diguanylate cyclase (GGDEF)-like protein